VSSNTWLLCPHLHECNCSFRRRLHSERCVGCDRVSAVSALGDRVLTGSYDGIGRVYDGTPTVLATSNRLQCIGHDGGAVDAHDLEN
jgi:hypothetical protein